MDDCGGVAVQTADGKTVYADEAVWCCGKAFSGGAAACAWAADDACAAELLAYARENGHALGPFIGANLDAFVFDWLNSGARARDAALRILRAFAQSDSVFFDWLDWEREKGGLL